MQRNLFQVLSCLGLAFGIHALGAPGAAGISKQEPFSVTLPKSAVEMRMVPVPGGTVKIDGVDVAVMPFFMASTETTWDAFDTFLLSGPASKPYDQTEYAPDAISRPSKSYNLPDLGWGHRGYPAINLNYWSAEMFCRWMSSVAGKKFRLPTEAEWELACRAGNTGLWELGAEAIEKQSWNRDNSEETTHPVGKKEPNKFGLFDMLGNVGEWATDMMGQPVLCGPTILDRASRVSPTMRRRYSEEWQDSDPQVPKSRWWLSDGPFVGFRVVCEG